MGSSSTGNNTNAKANDDYENNNERNNVDNEDSNEEELTALAAFLLVDEKDDTFVTEAQIEEEQAKQRRLDRKRRLQQVSTSTSITTNDKNIMRSNNGGIKKEDGWSDENDVNDEHNNNTTSNVSSHVTKTSTTITSSSSSTFVSIVKQTHEDENNGEENDTRNSDKDDEYDMFRTSVSPVLATKNTTTTSTSIISSQHHSNGGNDESYHKQQTQHKDDIDDAEGYYKATIGEVLSLDVPVVNDDDEGNDNNYGTNKAVSPNNDQFEHSLQLRVLGIIGKGVFSSVLKCATLMDNTNNNNNMMYSSSMVELPTEVAVKCIRSNETMSKAALLEIKCLIRLRDAPGIIPLLLPATSTTTTSPNVPIRPPPPIEYKGHTILIFPYQPYNLRDVLHKFGKGVGLSLTAVKSYYGQLLSAATHMQKHRILHADIKPDNILVSSDFNTLWICDFGSAMEDAVSDHQDTTDPQQQKQQQQQQITTPYLVSRFYRAPEIILGLPVLSYGIDLWSLAVTAAELFLGNVLLPGKNNNDMIFQMMKLLGPFSNRMIRSHWIQHRKHPTELPAHFLQRQSSYVFRQETIDPVLGHAVHKEVSLVDSTFQQSPTNLTSKLFKAKSPKDSRYDVKQFADLLTKCLVLDPSKRISVRKALQHAFFSASGR